MKCPHCLVEIFASPDETHLSTDVEAKWAIIKRLCPACKRSIFHLQKEELKLVGIPGSGGKVKIPGDPQYILVWPKGSSRPPCPTVVPNEFAVDYKEGCLVLPDSPKASAALSRRCLQKLLRDVANVKQGDLANEIQQVIDSKTLPSHLSESIDAIRNIGNFAAHPLKSTKSGEIIDVEPGEAEWNLDVLESLFDFYFVHPALLKKKRAALDAKLGEAGKPPMK